MDRWPITIWLPVAAVLFVATVAGGLGVTFMVLRGTLGDRMADAWGHGWQNTPVIVLGMAIVVLVPLLGALVHRKLSRRP